MIEFDKKQLFGIHYSITDYSGLSDSISISIDEKRSLKVCFTPVHGLMESQSDEDLKRALQSADYVLPDGQPIVWALNYFFKVQLSSRVYGPDLVKSLFDLRESSASALSVFLYGGSTPEVLERLVNWIHSNYNHVKVVGSYREQKLGELTLGVDKINASGASVVLVGLGCPVQEKWINDHADALGVPCLGVGAAFSLLSGNISTAPSWMQSNGLEWLYRLLQEPRRLFWRYLKTNSMFLIKVMILFFSNKLYSK